MVATPIIQVLKTDLMPNQDLDGTAQPGLSPKYRSRVSFAGHSAAVLGIVDNEPSSGTAQVLASLRDRITTTPSIMMNIMTIMIAIY